MWLVEVRCFPRIQLVFLAKGHTKNACDRLSNLLKLSYHHCNVYTYDILIDKVQENEFITAHKVESSEMFDFLKWQDIYYRSPKVGEFNTTHIFEISDRGYGSIPTMLMKLDYFGSDVRKDSLLPTKRNRKGKYLSIDERKVAIMKMPEELKILQRPGLREIKAVELCSKWRPLLPEWARESTCPKPSGEVIKSVRTKKNEKTKARTKRKRDLAMIEEQKGERKNCLRGRAYN